MPISFLSYSFFLKILEFLVFAKYNFLIAFILNECFCNGRIQYVKNTPIKKTSPPINEKNSKTL
jgi:hypothetical protein